jgi:hypothetical protein
MENVMENYRSPGYKPHHWSKLHRANSSRVDEGVVGKTYWYNMR